MGKGGIIMRLSSNTMEKTALIFLGLFYLVLTLLRNTVHPVLFFIHSRYEFTLKAFLVVLVFWGRYRLFAPYRSGNYLVFGFLGIFLMKISYYLYKYLPLENWLSSGLTLVEYAVLSVFYGIIIEFTFSVLDEVLRAEKPFHYNLAVTANRIRAGEEALPLMGKITVFYTIFIVFGLYVLNRVYQFDWFLYTKIGAFLLLTAVLSTLALFEKRLEKMSEPILIDLDRRLETLFKTVDFTGSTGVEREILFLVAFRKQLVLSGKL